MSRINKTLLEKLFLNPNPQPNRPDVLIMFNKLSYRMFPGKQDFMEFLKAQNLDRQYELAEIIIHRLCYVSNFPPSFFAMKDILCVEIYQKQEYTEADSFIPRDHFIHLINIYLLGIYIFFYNSQFFNRIVKDNQFERSEEPIFTPLLNEIKDFISEWKYFSLYHDIGYVPEIFSNKKKVTNANKTYNGLYKSSSDFQSSLLETVPLKQESFFSTLEIMSRIFVAKFVIKYSENRIEVKDKFFRHFKMDELIEIYNNDEKNVSDFDTEYGDLFSDTYILEKVYSNACLKYLLPVFDAKNIIILGIHKKTGKLSYFSFPEDKGRKVVLRKTYVNHSEVQELINHPQVVLYDEYQPKDFELYYVLKKDNAKKLLYDVSMFDESNVDYAFAIIEGDLAIHFSEISSENQLLDFYFEVYHYLYRLLRIYITPGRATRNVDAAKKLDSFLNDWECVFDKTDPQWLTDISELQNIIFEVIQKTFGDDIKESCAEYIRSIDVPISKKKSNIKDLDTAIDKVVDSYLKGIKQKISTDLEVKLLKSNIKDKYSRKMEQIASMLKIYSVIYSGIKTIFLKDKYSFSYRFDYSHRKDTFDSAFCEKYINKKVPRGGTYDTILKDYIIQYGNKINHGFASTQYAASVFSFLRHGIETPNKKPGEWKLIDILFGISNPGKTKEYISKYIYNYDHIFQNVLYAIMIHDVFPVHFKKASVLYKMKTSISDPFTYLALLTDALQDWNRPQALSVSLLDVKPNGHASEYYNIEVSNKGIFLFEEGSETSQARIEKQISGMTHLANIKAFLKNGYVQPDVL